VPDQTQRVTCPSCDSLLDTSQGDLRFLSSLPAAKDKIWIPPGTEGKLRGVAFTAIGFMRRSCSVEGMRYFWDEYLLYKPDVGFRWLMESDGHWNFIEPVAAADVMTHDRSASFQGKTFRKFQEVIARVETVRGEFYWKVSQGEAAQAADFVSAPDLLSLEISESGSDSTRRGGSSQEINWSRGTYLDGKEIWEAFKLPGDPPPRSGIAPNQPSPYRKPLRDMIPWTVGFLIAVMVLYLSTAVSSSTLFTMNHSLPLAGNERGEQVVFDGPIKISSGRKNLTVEVQSSVDNTWLYVEGALVSEQTGAVAGFGIETSYYHGSDWSEGNRSGTVHLSPLPRGDYMLRLAPQWEKGKQATSFQVKVSEGGARAVYALLAFLVIASGPLLIGLLHGMFENRRWQESMYSGESE